MQRAGRHHKGVDIASLCDLWDKGQYGGTIFCVVYTSDGNLNSFQTHVEQRWRHASRSFFLLIISLGVDALQLGHHIQQGEPQC